MSVEAVFVRTVPAAEWSLLKGLTRAEVEVALGEARHRTYRKGATVFNQGDDGDSVHVVAKGHFALRIMLPHGESGTLRVFGPGESIGRVVVPGRVTHRMGTLVALDEGETYELSREQVTRLLNQQREALHAVIEVYSQEANWLGQRLIEVLYLDADKRVRRRLLELQRQYTNGGAETVIGLTQDDLAGLAGTSRSTVNRVLRQEEAEGSLNIRRGGIVLLNTAGLAQRAI